jgi:hypothetical protein
VSHALLSAKVESAAPAAKSKPASTTVEITEPDDSFEREADRAAKEVMAGGATRRPQWSLAAISIAAPVHRKTAPSAPPPACPPIVGQLLLSPGQRLDQSARSFMEPRFGYDFSQVRIHTGPRAAESARAVNALAYTVGQDIVFGEDQYSPGTASGQRLLAHELAHFVQQGARQVVARPKVQRQAGPPQPATLFVDVAQLRAEVKKRGNPDVTALIDAFPDSLRNGASFTLPDTVLNGPNPVQGTNHKFALTFAIIPGAPPLFGDIGGGIADNTPAPTPAAPPSPSTDPFRFGFTPPQPATINHPISFFMYQRSSSQKHYDPAETLFHELVHLRLVIDKYLPLDRRSATGQRYGRMLTVAVEGENVKTPQLLAASKDVAMGAHRQEVLAKIGALRDWFTSWVKDKFFPARVRPDDALLEFLVNEKFTNQMANLKINNATIAGRYAGAVREMFVEASDQAAYAKAHNAAKQSTLDDDDTLTQRLQKSLEAWYNDIDQATSVPSGAIGTASEASARMVPPPLHPQP